MEPAQNKSDLAKRRPMRIRNRSNYFIPEKDRAYITIASPDSFQSKKVKIEGYESRLYWEFRYCKEHNGQTFFYTLTYSDKNIPKYYGRNVFDYKDLVWLLNGAFKKKLLREYGTNFKYFVGAELGEGAGVRGYANNPHYHILFFLRSAEKEEYPYKKITEREFQKLIREYWQGIDEGEPFRHHQKYRFGIVKESECGALVEDFRAISYVAKYVTKDVNLKQHERVVRGHLIRQFSQLFQYENSQLMRQFISEKRRDYFSLYTLRCVREDKLDSILMSEFIRAYGLDKEYRQYVRSLIDEQVRLKLNEYRNRYCNKCRISQGVGDYALDFIVDEMNPLIKIDTKNGPVTRTLSQYYYRKLFTEVVKDPCGNPIRILNDKGIEYRKQHLSSQLEKLKDKTLSYVQLIDKAFLEKLKSSDLNINVDLEYEEYQSLLKKLSPYETIKRYAEYKLVYENRFCEIYANGPTGGIVFDNVNVLDDFAWFIQPSYYQTSYDRFRVGRFLENGCKGYLSYNAHPYFLGYMRLFDLFDLLTDYLFVATDRKKEKDEEERKKTRSLHVARKLNNAFA